MRDERNTIQKTLVRRAVAELKTHPTAEELYEYVKAKCPCISKATVYRNLNALAGEGQILKIEVPNAGDRYDFNIARHNHFLCKSCGRMLDADVNLKDPDVSDLTKRGYEVHGYSLIFSGLCPDCAKSKKNRKENNIKEQ